jgi:23S rRNA pseudouridine2457 synthase
MTISLQSCATFLWGIVNTMVDLLVFNKPYGVLSQFLDHDGHVGLKKYLNIPDIYPMGRLDHDSEGLLLLSSDNALKTQITNPKYKIKKTYIVQVEGQVTSSAISALSTGVLLRDGITRPAKAKEISEPKLWKRNPPIRTRKKQTTSWIELRICEGKNRQIRRMTAHVGFPTLRLIRISIGSWRLKNIKPGEYRCEKVNLPQKNSRI